VAPLLVLIGVVLFRSSADGQVKNLGRVGIGLGLMLLALGALGHTLAPVETAPVLRTVLEALTGEPVLAVLIAGALTWACHSSVAVVLLIASLAASGVIAPAASLALVLGANLGGTLPPLFETGSGSARRLPLGNLLVRGAGVVVVLPFLALIAGLLAHMESAPARLVVNFHTAFNLALAVLFLPFIDRLAALLIRFLPDPPRPVDPGKPIHLEPTALDSASVALANARRCAWPICSRACCSGRSKYSVRATATARPTSRAASASWIGSVPRSAGTSPTSATSSRSMTRTRARGAKRSCRR